MEIMAATIKEIALALTNVVMAAVSRVPNYVFTSVHAAY